MDIDLSRWSVLFEQRVLGAGLTDSFRALVRLHDSNYFSSYAVRITIYVSGSVDIKIRHILGTGSVALSLGLGFYGCDFLTLGALDALDIQSVGYGIGAPWPAQVGNDLSGRGNQLRLWITTPAAPLNNFSYQLLGARYGVI